MISLIDSVWYSGILFVIFEEHVCIYWFADFCSTLSYILHIERRVRVAHGRVSLHAKTHYFWFLYALTLENQLLIVLYFSIRRRAFYFMFGLHGCPFQSSYKGAIGPYMTPSHPN